MRGEGGGKGAISTHVVVFLLFILSLPIYDICMYICTVMYLYDTSVAQK